MSSDERPAAAADDTPTGPTADGAPAPSPGGVPPAAVDAPPATPSPDAAPAPVPDGDTLERIATPAQRRRAPKISAFITTGVLLGVVVGWLLAVLGSGTSGEARTGAILLTTGALGVLGAILGAGLAALADRRSTRRAGRGRR